MTVVYQFCEEGGMVTTASDHREIGELRARLAELEAEVAALRAARPEEPTTGAASVPRTRHASGATSRRSLLRALAGAGVGAAVGTAAVVTSGRPAAAANGDPVKAGQDTTATGETRVFKGIASANSDLTEAALVGSSKDGMGTAGVSDDFYGVYGVSTDQIGVVGLSFNAGGVAGYSPSQIGVAGLSGDPTGLTAPPCGVHGDSDGGPGVVGTSGADSGVFGETDHGFAGVKGQRGGATSGLGVTPAGVWGDANDLVGVLGTASAGTGVSGRSASGTGVAGECPGAAGIAVSGVGLGNIGVQGYGAKIGVSGVSFTGLGGQFAGARAALRLVPRGTPGKPTSGTHERGELVVDSVGAVFVCTAGGTPGTWKKVSVS
jgi:hypothetical protein